MHNMKEKLLTGKKETVCLDLIEQIYHFENLNDFTKHNDVTEYPTELGKSQNKGRKKRVRSQISSTFSQFGNESNGYVNHIMQ